MLICNRCCCQAVLTDYRDKLLRTRAAALVPGNAISVPDEQHVRLLSLGNLLSEGEGARLVNDNAAAATDYCGCCEQMIRIGPMRCCPLSDLLVHRLCAIYRMLCSSVNYCST